MPGDGSRIDAAMLAELVRANKGKRGFTYTHKPMTNTNNRDAVRNANKNGFTVNLSANNLAHADELADLGIAPIAVVLAKPGNTRTPKGRMVAQCPASYEGSTLTCAQCGLCQLQNRAIVGLPVHGSGAKQAAIIAAA